MSSEPSNAPVEPARHASAATVSPAIGLIGLIAVIVGMILTVVGFLGGIDAALNGSGSGAAFYTTIFFVGGVLALAGLVFAIVRLVQRRNLVLSIITIVLALLPVVAVFALRFAAVGS